MRQESKLIIVRHAESQANVEGGKNPALWFHEKDMLTTAGQKQILTLIEELKQQAVDTIVCSDMPRARETATLIAEALETKVSAISPELREQRISEKILSQDQLGKLLDSWHAGIDFTFDGGESIADFAIRIINALSAYLYSGKTTLVVSHEGVINVLQAHLAGEDPVKARPLTVPYCAGRLLTWRGETFWSVQAIPADPQFKETLSLRKTVVAIAQKKGKVLVVHKKEHPPQTWTFPQGGSINFQETELQTIKRELREELAIDKVEVIEKLPYRQVFDWPQGYEGHKGFRGMEMVFYRVTLPQITFKIDNEELDDARWVNLSEIDNYIDFNFKYGYGLELKRHLGDIHEHPN